MKISVILPTYRINCQKELDNLHNYKKYLNTSEFGEEFKNLYKYHVFYEQLDCCWHILEPTLDCLISQKFPNDEYEILLCHKYPDDMVGLMRYYKDSRFPKIEVIQEKSSIWHSLGDYATVNNNRNTGILHAKGELLFFLDDLTIFNEHLLQNVWDNYQEGFYTTCKAIKRIKTIENKIIGTHKINGLEGDTIPNSSTWTYGMSVSMKDCLKINGFDEVWDGSFGGTDLDFGRRLDRVSRYKRKIGPTIYEFSHYSEQKKRPKIRDDEMLRQICSQSPIPRNIRANTWKPTDSERLIYRNWHESSIGELDKNWDKFMDVKLYDINTKRGELNE